MVTLLHSGTRRWLWDDAGCAREPTVVGVV